MKTFTSIFTTLVVLLLGASSAGAQEPALWQLTEDDGLPSMTVYQILQDQKGYIWMGTTRGLCRYDGRNFTSIDLPQLLDNEIIFLREDAFGRLWFNNLSGQIACLHQGKVQFLQTDSLPDTQLPLRFVLEDSSLYLSGKVKQRNILQYKLDFVSSDFRFKTHKMEAPHLFLEPMKKQKRWYSRRVLFKNDTLKLVVVDHNQMKVRYLPVQPSSHPLPKPYANLYLHYIADDGALYLSNREWLYCFREKLRPIYRIKDLQINRVRFINQRLWLLTNSGAHILDIVENKVDRVLFRGININAAYQDIEHNLWLGTNSQGVLLIPDLKMEVYTAENSGLTENSIYSLHYNPQQQKLYLGQSRNQLAILDVKTQQITSRPLPLAGRIMDIVEDQRQRLWLGTDNGLCVYDYGAQEFSILDAFSAVKKLHIDRRQQLWVGSAAYARNHGVINRYIQSMDDQSFLKSKNVLWTLSKRTYGLAEDAEGQMWMGTTTGVFVLQKDTARLLFNMSDQPPYSVAAIATLPDSSVWIATASEGLLQIREEKIVRQYRVADGLCSNHCRCLFADENRLYVGTDNGLNILDLNSGAMQRINQMNGLPSREVNAVRAAGRRVWLGTPKGLVAFDREERRKNTHPPKIWLSGLKINGVDTHYQQSLVLPYWLNTIDIRYEGLVYATRGEEEYQYRLLGLDEEWNTSSTRLARFHTLSPGKYEFQVKTVNEDGVESAAPATLSFQINSPWWQKPWFYISLMLGLMGISGGVVYWRQRDLRNREKVESELKDRIQLLRAEALRTQMNPHFIYNALNAIQDFFVTNDQEGALFYLSKFARMIRLIFDYSSRETISFEEEIEFLRLYLDLEKLRFGDRVIINLKVNKSLEARMSTVQLPALLIQPIIENAFKHGLMHRLERGQLDIQFEEQGTRIKCTVQDNGIGRTKAAGLDKWVSKQRTFSGLAATKERLSIWKPGPANEQRLIITDLQDAEGQPTGTKVDLLI
ncbi:MAG: two-component regulator propeller domain-containing protein [Bacteroidota bacterium]